MKGYYLMPHPPIIIPQVGKGEEKKIDKTTFACKEIGKDIASKEVETIILISPHGVMFRDAIGIITEEYVEGSLAKFNAPQVSMKLAIDRPLTEEIIKLSEKTQIPVVDLDNYSAKDYQVKIELDHGAIVPLYFILEEKQYKLVHITYGLLSPTELYRFGMAIKEGVKNLGKSAVVIASGDLSHRLSLSGPYSYSPYGKEFDFKIMDILEKGEISKLFSLDGKLIKEAGECGLRSLYIMAGAMEGVEVKGKVLSYEGTFGVGYGVASFCIEEGEGKTLYQDLINHKQREHLRRMEEGNQYTKLARKSLNHYYEERGYLEIPKDLPEKLLKEKRGVFVSLKKQGELRGCIGTISPTTSCIAQEIIKNAVSAAQNDPRFPIVKREELLDIDISVDILYEAEKATKEDLDPKNYGVIVSKGVRRGLLLPNLEGVDTKEEQLSIALQKAGIYEGENYAIERFKVERYKEVEDDE